MIVCRTFTLLFLTCITACGVCSSLFPLFRRKYYVPISNDAAGTTGATEYHRQETVYYWYAESTTAGTYPSLNYTRDYNDARTCDSNKAYFVASAALSTAGAGLSGIATIMTSGWVYAGFDSCLHTFIVFVTFLSFACYVVTVALVSYSYTHDACSDTTDYVVAPKNASPKFNLVEGFILMCIAAGGMLIATVLEALNFCFCTSADDYCGGGDGRHASSSAAVEDGDSRVYIPRSSSTMSKAPDGYSRTASSLSRSRGETSMSRRSSSGSLSRSSSSSSIDSSSSNGSVRSSRSGHRRPVH